MHTVGLKKNQSIQRTTQVECVFVSEEGKHESEAWSLFLMKNKFLDYTNQAIERVAFSPGELKPIIKQINGLTETVPTYREQE